MCGKGGGGGGMRLFSVMSDGTLRGEMKRYVKDMSGHIFAECGGTYIRVKNPIEEMIKLSSVGVCLSVCV